MEAMRAKWGARLLIVLLLAVIIYQEAALREARTREAAFSETQSNTLEFILTNADFEPFAITLQQLSDTTDHPPGMALLERAETQASQFEDTMMHLYNLRQDGKASHSVQMEPYLYHSVPDHAFKTLTRVRMQTQIHLIKLRFNGYPQEGMPKAAEMKELAVIVREIDQRLQSLQQGYSMLARDQRAAWVGQELDDLLPLLERVGEVGERMGVALKPY